MTTTGIDVERLRKIREKLPGMDFFQILNVKADASDNDIKVAFRKRSQSFHPDRFFQAPPEMRDLAGEIYKSVSLAYNATKNSKFRQVYIERLAKDRTTNLRFNPARAKFDASGDVQQAKQSGPGAKYYELAVASFQNGDTKSALTNIRLALTMESANEVFINLKAKVEALP